MVIETKGDYLDNPESKSKLKMGLAWANKSGERFRYFMVFEMNPPPDAHNLSQLMDILKEL